MSERKNCMIKYRLTIALTGDVAEAAFLSLVDQYDKTHLSPQ